MPGNRGFPGSDGLLGPKVSCHYCKKFLVDPDGTKGKETCVMWLKTGWSWRTRTTRIHWPKRFIWRPWTWWRTGFDRSSGKTSNQLVLQFYNWMIKKKKFYWVETREKWSVVFISSPNQWFKNLKLILGSDGTDWCSGIRRKTRPNGENVAPIKWVGVLIHFIVGISEVFSGVRVQQETMANQDQGGPLGPEVGLVQWVYQDQKASRSV